MIILFSCSLLIAFIAFSVVVFFKKIRILEGSIFGGIIFIISIIILSIIFLIVGSETVERKYVYSHSNNIMAFKDGNAYVISRYAVVDQSNRYYYLVKDQQGFIISYWVNQSNSRIKESQEVPHVKTYVQEFKTDSFYSRDMATLMNFAGINHSKKYDFYIPEGSVTQEFNVDLE